MSAAAVGAHILTDHEKQLGIVVPLLGSLMSEPNRLLDRYRNDRSAAVITTS
jgi:hypothetical protein